MTRKEFDNLKIGKIFQLGCRKFKVIESDEESACDECFFNKPSNWDCDELQNNYLIPECHQVEREDEKNVIFIEV